MFTEQEILRYARQFSLEGFGVEGQKKLKSAKILCVGCGGLAAPVVLYLAAAGVGILGLVDDDKVDESNLQRQVLFKASEVGVLKTKVLEKKIVELNPNVQVKPYSVRLNESNALDIIRDFDIVVDCTDNFYAKYLINDACFELKKPFVYGSVFQFEGQLSFFNGKTGPCFRCLFPAAPPVGMISNCAEEGILGVLPGLIGTLQATEVIKHLVGLGAPLLSKLFFFDTLQMSAQSLAFGTSSSCLICADKKGFYSIERPVVQSCAQLDLKSVSPIELSQVINEVTLIDVREPFEHEICNIGGRLIPLAQLQDAIVALDPQKKIVVYCKSGRRSQDAARLLLQAGCGHVSFLKGGILSWIDEIDSGLKRY